jgi:ABC-2 type transport system permease protein
MSTPSEVGGAGRGPSVIHDLGYRHYDGPRLGRAHIARALYLESAKGAYGLGRAARTKIVPMLLLGAICLPAFIMAVIAAVTDADKLPGDYTAYVLNVSLLVMVYVASQAPASVSRDLRFRVMSLYFSRPLERIDYVAAKYAAMASALFVLMALPLTILFVGALLAKLPIGEQVPDYLRSLGGAALTAMVVGGIGLVIAAITPRRGLGVGAIIAVLAVLAGVQGSLHAIATDQHERTFAGYSGLISPFTLVEGVQSSVFGAKSVMEPGPPGTVGALVYVAVTLAMIAACFGALLLRYRKVSI